MQQNRTVFSSLKKEEIKKLSSQFMQKTSQVFFLLLLTASHSSWALILLCIVIFKQMIKKNPATIPFAASITARFGQDNKPAFLARLESDNFIYNLWQTRKLNMCLTCLNLN